VYTNLANGPHTFTAEAFDIAGNHSPMQTQTWTQDTVRPIITVTGGPPPVTKNTSATFTFMSNEAGIFWCSKEGKPYVQCSSLFTMSSLAVGAHSFAVFAADMANNHSTTYVDTWTVQK